MAAWAAQTPEIRDFRPAQNPCIKNPSVNTTGLGLGCTKHKGLAGHPWEPRAPGGRGPSESLSTRLVSTLRGMQRRYDLSTCTPSSPKPYKFIGFGDIHGPKPYKFTGFGDMAIKPSNTNYKFVFWRFSAISRPSLAPRPVPTG